MVFKKGDIPWNVGIENSEETRQKIRDNAKINSNYGMKGKHFSEESKKKICIGNRGKKRTIEERRIMSKYRKGRLHLKEWNNKVSIALKGKKKSNEHIINMTKANEYRRGKTFEQIFGEEKAKDIRNKLSKKLSLENNPRWNGGTSFEDYDNKFNIRFKSIIRKRDNQVCMVCGIHREKIRRALDIHHIDYNKKNTCKENCVSLCYSCHSKTNANRHSWTKFFQSLLAERYNYSYSEQLEPILTF